MVSMNSKGLEFQYELAEGPEGLTKVLETFLTRTQNDPAFAAETHYILYKRGEQQSLLRVDTNQKPFHFWYCDLLGRPATKSIKDVIADFLWEKCGEKEKYL